MAAQPRNVTTVRPLLTILLMAGTLLSPQSAAQSAAFQRGEHVRVKAPTKPSDPQQSEMALTIVAIPNDQIRVTDSAFYVNDREISGFSQELLRHVAHSKHTPRVVPEDHYLVMGEIQWTFDDSQEYWGVIPTASLETARQRN